MFLASGRTDIIKEDPYMKKWDAIQRILNPSHHSDWLQFKPSQSAQTVVSLRTMRKQLY